MLLILIGKTGSSKSHGDNILALIRPKYFSFKCFPLQSSVPNIGQGFVLHAKDEIGKVKFPFMCMG